MQGSLRDTSRAIGMLLVLLITLQFLSPEGTAAAPEPRAGMAPNQVLVGFEPGAGNAARDAAVARVGGRTVDQIDDLGVRLVDLPPGLSVAAAVGAFKAAPGVRYAEPNHELRASRAPNDPLYAPYGWGLNNTGQPIAGAAGTPGVDISAEDAWEVTTGSAGIVVGVLDSGTDLNHPDLVPNLWSAPAGWSLAGCGAGTRGYDAAENDCVPQDANGHGTHVAGTIGARGDNGAGVAGVNWTVSIMTLRFLDASGGGYLYDAVEAINYAIQAKQRGVNLRVLNASYGSGQYAQSEVDAIRAARDNGILFVAAAGNAGANNDTVASYPANYDLANIVSVAATDNRDGLASFSNYGASSVDLGAPGVNIASTLPTYPVPANGNSASTPYGYFSGTSMAAPHVAGAAALTLAAPGLGALTVAELRERLLNCGDALSTLSGRTAAGKRLNAHRAITGCNAAAPPANLRYYPLPHPVRLLDTRPGERACVAPGAPLVGGSSLPLTARGTCDGVTIPAGAQAVVGNATAVNSTGAPAGFVTLYPTGAARPTVSNLNYVAGQIVPNAFTVGLGGDGAFNIFATSGIHFIVDLTGYYAPPEAGGLYYHPLPTPLRLLDTRAGAAACDAGDGPLAAGVSRTQATRPGPSGPCASAIPATARAIAGNATVVNSTGALGGFATLYPDEPRPAVSNLNYVAGQIVPNAFTVGLGGDGAFNIFATSGIHFIVDVAGYFDDQPAGGLLFTSLPTPLRLLDTRGDAPTYPDCDPVSGPLTGGVSRTEATRFGASGPCGTAIPAEAQALVGNATAVNVTGAPGGFATLYPNDPLPTVSNLNYAAGQVVPNAFTVGLAADDTFRIYATSGIHFIVDVAGYFAP